MAKMNPEIKKIWVEALRSGKYKQGQAHLHYSDKFCCLGVLCDIASQSGVGEWRKNPNLGDMSFGGSNLHLPHIVIEWAGLPVNEEDPRINGVTLSSYNDNDKSFSEIADLIEENL